MTAPVVCASEEAVGRLAAELIANRLVARPGLRMLLPTGRTPRGMYVHLRRLAASGGLHSRQATVLQLDEYVGLAPDDPMSFAAELRRQLEGVGLRALETIDGAAADLEAEAVRHRRRLESAPLDLAVLGVGRNGHVAFDEPWSDLAPGVQLVQLARRTRADAEVAMRPRSVPERGLTTGLGTLLGCRELIVLVTGQAKAEILRAILQAPPTPECPASVLRSHPRLTVICDPAAASALGGGLADHVIVVLGHRDPGVSPEHRISHESLERLQRGHRLVGRRPTRAVILTGYTSTGGLSEAEQMATVWADPDVPFLLEVAGRNTAGNAACSFPLIEALGGVERVTVVTSAWHLRTPFFFRPYRTRGLRVRVRREWRGRGWLGQLIEEFVKAPLAGRERRDAWRSLPAPAPHDPQDEAALIGEDKIRGSLRAQRNRTSDGGRWSPGSGGERLRS